MILFPAVFACQITLSSNKAGELRFVTTSMKPGILPVVKACKQAPQKKGRGNVREGLVQGRTCLWTSVKSRHLINQYYGTSIKKKKELVD